MNMRSSQHPKSSRPRKSPIRGISRDAARLGVSREWLRKVLIGEGVSAPLLKRYRGLRPEQKIPPKVLQKYPA